MKRISFFIVWLLTGAPGGVAQETTTAGGGNISGSGGSAAYSIGQVSYTCNSGGNGIEWQGVQQVYTVQSTSVTDPSYQISLAAFPNPASEVLNLQVGDRKNEKLSFSLFDASGKLVMTRNISSSISQIDLRGMASASYMLIVSAADKIIHSFKIIKK